jgi:hypothetical protein
MNGPGFECRYGQEIFLFSGAHQAPYSMGTGGSFPGVKRPERETNHSPPSSAEVKNQRNYTSTPLYAFKDSETFTFTFTYIFKQTGRHTISNAVAETYNLPLSSYAMSNINAPSIFQSLIPFVTINGRKNEAPRRNPFETPH